MCGRYFLEESPELRPIIEEMNRSPLMTLFQDAAVIRSGEVRPTAVVPAIASNRSGKRTVYPMQWGFAGKTGLLMIRQISICYDLLIEQVRLVHWGLFTQ